MKKKEQIKQFQEAIQAYVSAREQIIELINLHSRAEYSFSNGIESQAEHVLKALFLEFGKEEFEK